MFERTEQQNMIEQALERFVREKYTLADRQKYLQQEAGFSEDNWAFMAELGLLGMPFSEQEGGFGGSVADVSQVMRQLGKGLVAEPYLQVVVAGKLLAASSNDELKAAWLEAVISGEKRIALVHVERGDPRGGSAEGTTLKRRGDDWVLSGSKCLVPSKAGMDLYLVTARDEQGELNVCALAPDTQGLQYRHYNTVDGQRVADLHFDSVSLSAQNLLAYPSAELALHETLTYANSLLCGEVVGIMEVVVNQTVDYAKTREQFGKPIGSFQVLKHRLADAMNLVLQADGMALLAASDNSAHWAANVAAAKAFIGESALHVGHEAIQMHGGMGLTDELVISHYHKRLVVITRTFGTVEQARDQFARCRNLADPERHSSALDFADLLTEAQQSHHQDVCAFFANQLDDDIATAVRRQSISWPEVDVATAWQKKLNAQGWLAPLWPKEYGGTGWSPIERFVFEYESGRAGAPEQIPMGYRYVGPVIAHFGSDWQKEYFLPKMLESEHQWAQGFSEPGAGSDLTALKTTAVLDGDEYVVNGSKMWTTNAHVADWIFCLVRTDKGDRPQQGISFLLIDMKSPGVRVEPIPLLAVDHEVNQVFFDNVRVDKKYLVGDEGAGWGYAKFLLELERGGTVFSGSLRSELNHISDLVNDIDPDSWHNRLFVHRLAALEERLMALELYEYRTAQALMSSPTLGAAGSVIKLISSELQKDITELAMDCAGVLALELTETRPMTDLSEADIPGNDLELVVMPKYLNMRVASIYGGSSEIQREIIAKQLLGLR